MIADTSTPGPHNDAAPVPGLFTTELVATISATVTHPPGTTFDDQGNPQPPEGAQ